jgi:hypothetical protein
VRPLPPPPAAAGPAGTSPLVTRSPGAETHLEEAAEGVMPELLPELERRRHRRARPRTECEVFIGPRRFDGTIEDVSRGGVFVRTRADAGRGTLIRVAWEGEERFALVVHLRTQPHGLRWLASGGLGLRWVRLGTN